MMWFLFFLFGNGCYRHWKINQIMKWKLSNRTILFSPCKKLSNKNIQVIPPNRHHHKIIDNSLEHDIKQLGDNCHHYLIIDMFMKWSYTHIINGFVAQTVFWQHKKDGISSSSFNCYNQSLIYTTKGKRKTHINKTKFVVPSYIYHFALQLKKWLSSCWGYFIFFSCPLITSRYMHFIYFFFKLKWLNYL